MESNTELINHDTHISKIKIKNSPKNPEFFKKRVCVAYANDCNSKYYISQNCIIIHLK